MSDLLAFDDDEGNLFVREDQGKSRKPTRNLDDLFGSTDNTGLDDVLTSPAHDDIFKPQANTKKKPASSRIDDLFGAEEEDEFDFFSSNTKSVPSDKAKAKSTESKPLDSLDVLLGNVGQSESTEKSHGISTDQSNDSLDLLLDSQPEGMVTSSDDLLSMMEPVKSSSPSKPQATKKVKRMPSKRKSRDSQPTKNLFEEDDQSDLTGMSGGDATQSSLDMLLDAQPEDTVPASDNLMSIMDLQAQDSLFDSSVQQTTEDKASVKPGPVNLSHDSAEKNIISNNKTESKVKSHGVSHDMSSLDVLLDAQPEHTVPASDNLMSILDEKQEDDSLFSLDLKGELKAQKTGNQSEPVEKSHVTKVETSKPVSKSEAKVKTHDMSSLDVLLDSQPEHTIPASDNLMSILDEKQEDDSLFSLDLKGELKTQKTGSQSELGDKSHDSKVGTSKPASKSEPKVKSRDMSSLDVLLDAQPEHTVPASDNLMSILDEKQEDDSLFSLDLKGELKTQKTGSQSELGTKSHDSKVGTSKPVSKSEPKVKSRDMSSLDVLLDAQPEHTVPASDNLMSILDEKQEDDSLFSLDLKGELKTQKTGSQSELGTKSHDSKVGTSKPVSKSEPKVKSRDMSSLDVLLDAQPEHTVPASDNLMSILDEKQEDDSLFSIGKFAENRKPNDQSLTYKKSHDLKNEISKPVSKSDSTKQSHGRQDDMDSLDTLPDCGPSGLAPMLDDLLSVGDPHTNNPALSSNKQSVAWDEKQDSPVETPDPIDDSLGNSDQEPGEITAADPSDTVEDSGVAAPTEPKTNLKKRMERSFEDLLTGLSDESEPELDDMIDDSNDNTNLESLLFSPNKSVTQSTERTVQHSTPYSSTKPPDNTDTKKDSLLDDYDFGSLKSTEPEKKPSKDMDSPKDSLLEDFDLGSMQKGAPEVKLDTPEDENTNSMRSWEMVDQYEVTMRHRNGSHRSQSESEDIDLSAIEDTNHLDVDVNKHKSALGKKGSLALRRKPSRKSRKSLMSTGEDAIFQDSSDPKPSGMQNGEEDESDEDDQEIFDQSPPAKKPSPGMVPLPGFGAMPPHRLSGSSPQDEDMAPPQEIRRTSKPPPGAFRLPAPVMPTKNRSTPDHARSSSPDKNSNTSSHGFEKPALRATKPREERTPKPEPEVDFSTPVLKKVGSPREVRRRLDSEEKVMPFEKPALRSTPKPGVERGGEEKMDTNTGVFTKPQLRNTPNLQSDRLTRPAEDSPAEPFESRKLRSTPKREIDSTPNSDRYAFEKPRLRNTGRPLASVDRQTPESVKTNASEKTFEKPVLRPAMKDNRSDSFGDKNESPSYTYEKPLLKNTPNRPSYEVENSKKDQYTTGVFSKPSLKKASPSPEKETKPFNEPKGTFDKPALRRTEGSRVTEQRGQTSEKPSWLQTAAEKQHKALDALQTKENQNGSAEKEVPSWLDPHRTMKNLGGLPLQENSSNNRPFDLGGLSDNVKKTTTPRSRESSVGSEDSYTKKTPTGPQAHNNYTPAWMRQGRSPSTGQVTGITSLSPATSTPTIGSDEVPQWKKDLAQRRLNKKDSPSHEEEDSGGEVEEEIPKKEDTKEPEWKRNIHLKKVQPRESPAKEGQSSEPEWMKKAEEKRNRLRSKSLQYSNLKLI